MEINPMGDFESGAPDKPELAGAEIWECLNNPVVVPSPVRTPEERQENPSEMTLSFKEIQEQLRRAGLVE
jgi:hypothetical protein